MPEFIEQFFNSYGYFFWQILVFVVVLTGLWLSGKYVVISLVDRFLNSRDMNKHARTPLLTLTRIFVLIAAVSIAFGVAGFDTLFMSLGTIGAAATLAVGFALQSLISNFASGVVIFLERSFRIGDWLEWGEHEGIVTDIQLRVTRVETFDNELLTVPNSDLTNSVVKNPVANDQLRIRFVFNIAYGDDIGKATEVILEEANTIDAILEDPEPSVQITELGDSQVGLESRFWIEQPARSDFVKTRSEYVRAVKERFDKEGIEIPFPQRALSGVVEFSKPVEDDTEPDPESGR